jgi:hypothetical protein
MAAKARDPVRLAKIAAAKREKPRSEHNSQDAKGGDG